MSVERNGKGPAKGVIGRRGFLGAVAASAATALTAGGATPAFASETGADRTKTRYRETDHVKAYYASNRYYKGE